MTRRRFFAYHVCAALGFCGTLMGVAPALSPLAVGFSAVYLVLLAGAHVIGWLTGGRLRFLGFPVMVVITFGVIGAAGGPEAAMVAALLAVYSYWPRRYG